jgi:DNA-binding response OmpR family regulator
MKRSVLLIEDEAGVRESLAMCLKLEGYDVMEAGDGTAGLRLLEQNPVVVILDVLLPGRDGFAVLREIRLQSRVPVMMLTALDEIEWRVKGLKGGADDYLVKPYALAELLARLEALLRRAQPGAKPLRHADLELFPAQLCARRNGRLLELSPKAVLLLQTFLENPLLVLPKDRLMRAVWGQEVEPNTLEVHLSALRRAIGEPSLIQTVRGYGYVLREAAGGGTA